MTEPTLEPDEGARPRDRFLVGFVLLGAALLAASAWVALWDQDEGAYASFGLHMWTSGDWIAQSVLWSQKHRKPPLHLWTIAASIGAFGANEVAVRLSSLVAVALTPLTIPWLGSAVFGRETARRAAIVLFATLFFPNLGKVAVTDALFTLFQTVAALAIVRTVELGPSRGVTALLWMAVALGVLTKGPPILILVVGLITLLALVHPERRRLVRLHPWLGLPLALAPLLIWGRLAWERDGGELVRWLFDWYVVQRVSAPVLNQTGPPGSYLLFFAVTFLPWARYLPRALAPFWEPLDRRERRIVIGALVVAFVVWLLTLRAQGLGQSSLPFGLVSIAAGAVAILAVARKPRETPLCSLVAWYLVGAGCYEFLASKLPTYSLGAAAAVAILVARAIEPRDRRPRRIALATVGTLLAAWLVLVPLVEPWRGAPKIIAASIVEKTPAGARVHFADKLAQPSFVFYLERTGRPCSWDQADFTKLAAAYRAPEPAVLVFEETTFQGFKRFLGQDPPAERFEGWQLDKLRRVHYVVLRNDAAR